MTPTGKHAPDAKDPNPKPGKAKYEVDLSRNAANYQPLSPLTYLERTARIYPGKLAVVDGERRFTYAEFYERCVRLASALRARGVRPGDTVTFMATNSAPLLEAHYGVAMCGGVLNALNYRLDADTIGFILGHAETTVLVTDREFSSVIRDALSRVDRELLIIDIDDPRIANGDFLGELTYEAFLESGDPNFQWLMPDEEWDAISLNYTSGTTGNPKGVVYHHRGAFLNAMSNAMVFGVARDAVYLWTLPMFHCNGWTFTWGVTAVGGTHVCLRTVDPAEIFRLIATERVTHMCGAPIVLNAIANAPEEVRQTFSHTVEAATGGAAPPSSVIATMERLGFRVTHLYGLTEVFGPATYCAWQDDWAALELDERAAKMARQGVHYPTLTDVMVADPETLTPVPNDAQTLGEVMIRGNTVMKGYLKNPSATDEAFAGGWFHTGDLAVTHADGYVELKDRSKDIIISGGENISSIEVEEALYKHPDILEAAVVARPDDHWGETPCAFVTLRPDHGQVSEADIIEWCRSNLARYKVPKTVVFGDLPKTNTGKVQKFVLRDQAKTLAEP
ncbi:MAG: acyl-CoA synthetase [Pseudomonadota bacterium]